MTTKYDGQDRACTSSATLLVVSASIALAERFSSEFYGPLLEGGDGLCINGSKVILSVMAGNPKEHPDWERRVTEANAVMVLVDQVDTLSMEELKAVYANLPPITSSTAMAFFILREPNKKEFKVSCLKCGQKIMLRDEYVGRSCNCPNCRKPFMIVSQKMALRQQLRLPLDVQVEQIDGVSRKVTRAAMERLIERATPIPRNPPSSTGEALKHTTMRIEVSDLKRE